MRVMSIGVVLLLILMAGCAPQNSGAARVDLVGKSRCEEAINCLDLTLKNNGTRRSGDVTVSVRWFVVADEVSAATETVDGIKPGSSTTVRLVGVGERPAEYHTINILYGGAGLIIRP